MDTELIAAARKLAGQTSYLGALHLVATGSGSLDSDTALALMRLLDELRSTAGQLAAALEQAQADYAVRTEAIVAMHKKRDDWQARAIAAEHRERALRAALEALRAEIADEPVFVTPWGGDAISARLTDRERKRRNPEAGSE